MYTVIKRNGTKASLDISKISKIISWAAQGLDINPLELESSLTLTFRNDISTSEIQKELINCALKLTSVEKPDWRILAGRLLIFNLYKEAGITRKYEALEYNNYVQFVHEAINKGLYDPNITKFYTDAELKQAESYMDRTRDYDFDFAGANLLAARYLITDKHKVFELPQEAFLTVSLLLASKEPKEKRMEVVKLFYEMISRRKVSLATPLLGNLRKPNGNLSSCFIMAVDDNIDSIFYSVGQIAQISKNGGGVGVNLSRIRGTGAEIKNTPGASGGVIPWIKIINDTAVAVNQLGKRAGAVTIALDIWHYDIEQFLELQTENGDLRRKAFDIFPQVVLPDLFMRRVEANQSWTTFDPHEVRSKYNIELAELWGDKFEEAYTMLEKQDNLALKKILSAKEIMKHIMKSQIETGMPYIFFKDTANRLNPNQHDGMIGNANLCVESFSNFKPSKIGAQIIEAGNTLVQKAESGLIHTCNLVSINLANVNDDELEKICSIAVRILDNTIDLTEVPINEGKLHNDHYRTIGVGCMGLADYLAKRDIQYSKAHDVVENLFENICYYSVRESVLLAEERGKCEAFDGSEWSKGIICGKGESYFSTHHNRDRWLALIEKMKKVGIRNSQILAIAPNTSSSLLQGCTASILPIFNKFFIDKNSKGSIPVCPPYIRDKFWVYQENKNIDQKAVVEIVARIQEWTDTGISMELLYNFNNNMSAKDIYDTIILAWKLNIKTIYYTRSIQKTESIKEESCVSCAN